MSQIARIRTHMVDPALITKALDDLEKAYEVVEEGRNASRGDIWVKMFGPNLLLQRSRDGYDAICSVNRTRFVRKLVQRYAYQAARAKLEAQGFTLASEEIEEEGRIHLTLRRMT